MIHAHALTYAYPDGVRLKFPDIRCTANDQLLILGESGCGKSTLLQLLAGIRTPATGSVSIKDTALHTLNGAARDAFRGKHIGIVFQTPHFLEALTIRENLFLAQKMAGNVIDRTKVTTLLTRLGIAHRGNAYPRQCSQGELQRTSIARALINEPLVVLADEPTSALDDRHCETVIQLLEEQSLISKAALIVVTHDQRLKSYFPQTITLTGHV